MTATTLDQLLEPAVELDPSMTVSDLAICLRCDEPGFLRKHDDGWEAVLPHLLVAQPASRRVIDVPRLSVEAVPHDAMLTELPALLDRATLGCSPVVDGPALVGRLDHERLRAWLTSDAESDVVAELSRLRLATQAMLHDLANVLLIVRSGVDDQNSPGACEAFSQSVEILELLRSLHRGAPIASASLDVGEVVARQLPLVRALCRDVARVEVGDLQRVAALCPPALLERTLISFVTNSREAMVDGGSFVRIDVEADQREVRMRVCDGGPGIPDHLVPRLFERGFSTKGSPARGTGLASLREAARGAGGDLRFERGTSGATFVLALRRAPS